MIDPLFEAWTQDDTRFSTPASYSFVEATANVVPNRSEGHCPLKLQC